MTVDAIILTYKPTEKLIRSLEMLYSQTVRLNKVYIYNTEEQYFHAFMYGRGFLEKHKNIEVTHLSKKEFNHGKTRAVAMEHSEADYVLMMSDDAVPADENLIENLIKAASPDDIAMSYARQLPNEDARDVEVFSRTFNYPEESVVKRLEDAEKIGIKAFFCSDVCAMYKKSAYDAVGGFVRHTILNEDSIFAYSAQKAGYGIAYAADACVYHSHNYSNKIQFKRMFDVGVSHAEHPEIFAAVPPASEGKRMVFLNAEYFRKNGKIMKIPGLFITSAYKYLGYYNGVHYKRLSKKKILKYTLNKEYWAQDERKKAIQGIDASLGYGRSEAERRMRTGV